MTEETASNPRNLTCDVMNQLMTWEWQLGSGNSFRLNNTCLFDQDIFSPIKLFECECEILWLGALDFEFNSEDTLHKQDEVF